MLALTQAPWYVALTLGLLLGWSAHRISWWLQDLGLRAADATRRGTSQLVRFVARLCALGMVIVFGLLILAWLSEHHSEH